MNQKKLSRYLILAGILALAGVLFLFWGLSLFTMLTHRARPLIPILQMAMGVPYLLALRQYFLICRNIGDDRSFCTQNAQSMNRIARDLFLASALWGAWILIGAILSITPEDTGLVTHAFGGAALYVRMGLALVASLAVGLVARVMALLLARACRLQEENDLTI